MPGDYNEYLAIKVLNEQQHVNYRSLSRALKVHSNLAKQMLYEFHRKQNAKKPGAVHATYLITGSRLPQTPSQTNGVHNSQDGEDTVMQSSPPLPSSSMPTQSQDVDERRETITLKSVMLAKEEHLDKARALFDSITGIHIYSLQADGLSDIQVLTDCNRQVAVIQASEDPLKDWRKYGTIQNSNAKRRTTKHQPAATTPQLSTEAKVKPAPPTSKPTTLQQQASEDKEVNKSVTPSTSAKATPEPEKQAASKPATVKRQNSSLFKAFAKGKDKPKKPETNGSTEGAPAAEPEDEAMGGLSADEDDREAQIGDEEAQVPAGKSRKDRQAELEAMMDAEDQEMDDAPNEGAIGSKAAEEQKTGEEKAAAEDEKGHVEVSNGRRRGRRRVMKRKTVRDEEGYLVTKEEPAWESFSEEEPAPKKARLPPVAQTAAAKGGKKGGKPGQGDIMSFFSKK